MVCTNLHVQCDFPVFNGWWLVVVSADPSQSVWCTRPSLGVLGFNNNLLPSIHMLAGPPLCPALLTPITATIVSGLHGISLIVYSSCPSNVQGVVGVSKAQRVSMFNGPTCSTGLHQLTRAFNGHDAASHRPGQPSMSVWCRKPPKGPRPGTLDTARSPSVQVCGLKMPVLRWGVSGQ